MKFPLLLLTLACFEHLSWLVNAQECHGDLHEFPRPYVKPERWLPNVLPLKSDDDERIVVFQDVLSYSQPDETCDTQNHPVLRPVVIGRMPQMNAEQTLSVLQHAKNAWRGGSGAWTQMSLQQRMQSIRNFFAELSKQREAIIRVLQWEIGKNRPDAEAEFDRTVTFCEQLLEVLETHPEFQNTAWETIPGTSVSAVTRRAAIGIILALAPYNYPINESYATIIPALLMGNVVILKIPTTGGLAHLLTMEAFEKTLPPGTMNFISGSGRSTMPVLMKTGNIDGLAFIGGSNAADKLIHDHPHPHRLKVFLQLEAKNMAIILDDVFTDPALLENTLNEVVLGSLSYNGQRCTALKILFVPRSNADVFVKKFVDKVNALKVGLSWQKHENGTYSQITPLPNPERVKYMQQLIEDAVSKGATIMNARYGGHIIGGELSTLMVPAILYPAKRGMRIYTEEQFGPVVPIAVYDELETVLAYGQNGDYGQQVSIFGHNTDEVVRTIDRFSAVFGKINLNAQCGRSPDTLPFSGRRSSAMGVMSVTDALREFSVPTVVTHKNQVLNGALVEEISQKSIFLQSFAAIH
jgi:glyceraldehyde-3-phosphate dehydrogenase (NADP+)